MKTQNKVQLIGYVGDDPLITTTSKGDKKAHVRVATVSFHKDNHGIIIKKTIWHDVIAWREKADMVENNFLKGSHILVEGEILYNTYEDRTGHIRYVTEIKAQTLMNLDR